MTGLFRAAGLAVLVTVAGLSAPSVAVAGPFVAWAQYEVPGDRYACRDRAKQAMQGMRQWRVWSGKQHVYGEDDQVTAWVRCWELSGGERSIATIVVTSFRSADWVKQIRDQIRDALR